MQVGLVYDGPINYNGWTEITLSTPFDYNGTDNLIIHYESRHGSSSYANFNSTTSTTNNNKGLGNDGSFPTGNGYLNPYPSSRPNVRLFYAAGSNPCTPEVNYPQNAAIKVSITPTLSFDFSCNTTSYDLYFGTSASGMQAVASNVSVPNEGTYTWQPSALLEPSTEYTWMVVAKNGGLMTESPVMTFTTEGVINNFPYFNGFENNEVWTPGWYGDLSLTNWYYMSTPINWNLASPLNVHTGQSAAYINMSQTGSWPLVTPRIILGDNKLVRFWWRNNSVIIDEDKSSVYDTTYFQISTDGGENWATLDILSPETPNEWTLAMYDLSSYSGNNVKLRWLHSINSIGGNKAFFIHDLRIEGSTNTPEILLSSSSHAFGDLCQNGLTTHKVVITNQGSGNLVISGVTVQAPFSSTYSGTIAPGATDTATMLFNATEIAAATYNKTATFNITGEFTGSNTISLSGSVIVPVQSIFETFETTTINEIPTGWKKFRTSDPNEQFNDVLVKTGTQYEYVSPTKVLKFLNANDSISFLAIILPGVTNFATHELSFWATKGAFDETLLALVVGVTSDPYNSDAFEAVETIVLTDQITKYTVNFDAANTKPYIVIAHNNILQWRSIYLDDLAWQDPTVVSVPNPAQITYPALNATSVDIMPGVKLQWANGGGNPTGYRISVGTNNPPSNIVDNLDVADATNYLVNRDLLDFSTPIFWKVVPYNNQGDAENCPIWNFATMADPTVSTFPWIESFESVAATSGFDCPLGWVIENNGEQFVSWDLILNNQSAPDNAYDGEKSMHNSFGFVSNLDDWMFTPPMYLQGGETYEFSFWTKVKRFNAETSEALEVKWGMDNNSTAMYEQPLFSDEEMIDENWTYMETQLVPTSDGFYYFGFHSFSQPLQFLTFVDLVRVDHIMGINSSNQFEAQVYPNPANDKLLVKSQEMIEKIAITDIAGKTIMDIATQSDKAIIDVADLSNGLYILNIHSAKGIYSTKVVKN